MASRDLKDAHSDLQLLFALLSARFTSCFPGWKLLVVTTYRPPEEQLIEFKAGRSQVDGTKKVGKHNKTPSDAIDVMIVSPGGKLLDTMLANKQVSREQFDAMYWLVGLWVQAEGCRCGYDWDGDRLPVGPDPHERLNDPYHWERI